MTSQFPYAANEVHRLELPRLSLEVVEGAIPDALSGHLFVVAAVGNFGDEDGEPRRNTLLNGDGMIYRIDFDSASRSARVTSRLVQPACFHADEATRKPRWSYLGFRNLGLARMSSLLGVRNFGNTALVPMPAKESTRLLVTYDVGRPLEIDPVTLKTITPVGQNKEWMGEFGDNFPNQPFKLVLTTAHPVWDMRTGHLFTVNYARSGPSVLTGGKELIALLLTQMWRLYRDSLGKLVAPLLDTIASCVSPAVNRLFHVLESDPRLLASTQWSVSHIASLFGHLAQWAGLFKDSCLRVARWDGEGRIECWDVVLPNGDPVRIQNSMHQIAVTQDYVILADTGFKVALNQLYCGVFSAPAFDRLLRLLLSRRALSDMPLYIVRRADLQSTNAVSCRQGTVTATPVRLPFGAVHFLADYDNSGDQITLHAGHGSAVDIAEWVRAYDTSPWTQLPVEEWLSGMVTSAADVARLGRYVIDGRTGRVQGQQILSDSDAMWSLALYAGPGIPAWGDLPDRNERLYWFSNGFWPQLLTEFVLNLYARAPGRVMTVEQVLEVGQKAPPSPCLFSVDTNSMTIVDRYHLDGSRMMSSPQFIPHPGGAADRGWIAAFVLGGAAGEERCELWIFDAHQLSRGPVARLGAPQFKFGFTLHTAWMSRIQSSTSSYYVHPRQDFESAVSDDCHLRRFFEEEIYPLYPQDRCAASGAAGEETQGR